MRYFIILLTLAGLFIHIDVLAADYPFLEYPDAQSPWTIENYDESNPYRIFSESGEFAADAYTLLSADGIFDKPFIFVEGIDFKYEGYISSNLGYPAETDLNGNSIRNGTFGWSAFTGADEEHYPMLHLHMPKMLNELYLNNYDIILLDFVDGADYIENNAAILKNLIKKVNEFKVGYDQIVVSGASMGGQVARVALRELELENYDPCARLYVSLDSPHQGASIPIGLQELLDKMRGNPAHPVHEANAFFNQKLDRPAAQQLMIHLYEGGISKHEDYYNYVNEIGLPVSTRNIAISNGNADGVGLNIPNNTFLSHSHSNGDDEELIRFQIETMPHEVCNYTTVGKEGATGISFIKSYTYQLGIEDFSDSFTETYDGGPGGGLIWEFTNEWAQYALYHPDLPGYYQNFEAAPGGLRNSIDELVSSINVGLIKTNYEIPIEVVGNWYFGQNPGASEGVFTNFIFQLDQKFASADLSKLSPLKLYLFTEEINQEILNFLENHCSQPYYFSSNGCYPPTYMFYDVLSLYGIAQEETPLCIDSPLDGGLPLIYDGEYSPNHAFISTSSALGLGHDYLWSDIRSQIENNPEILPFDDYYSPYAVQEAGAVVDASLPSQFHSEISAHNAVFLLHNVLNGENMLNESLNEDQSYNLADPIHRNLETVDIYGELNINGGMNFNFDDSQYNFEGWFDYEVAGTTLNIGIDEFISAPKNHRKIIITGCNDAIVSVHEGGRLNIGGVNGSEYDEFTAEVVATGGSKIVLHEGSILTITSGSTLRIQSGARLTLEGGVLDIQNGGSLIIEEGGHLDINNSQEILLQGPSGLMDVYGSINVALETEFGVEHPGMSGKIRIIGAEAIFNGGSSSSIVIVGDGEDDLLIETLTGANMQVSPAFGSVTINDCYILMREGSEITANEFQTARCQYRYVNSGLPCSGEDCFDQQGIRLNGASEFINCKVENIFVEFENNGVLTIVNSEFTGDYNSPINISSGSVDFNRSKFTNLLINAEELGSDGEINRCTFTDSELIVRGDVQTNIEKSKFIESPILVDQGILHAFCSKFTNIDKAITLKEAFLMASADYDAGFNFFSDNEIDVFCEQATGFNINNGFNYFANQDYYFKGYIKGNCSYSCNVQLHAGNNYWTTFYIDLGGDIPTFLSGEGVNDEKVSLTMYDENLQGCSSGEFYNPSFCTATVEDSSPLSSWSSCKREYGLSATKQEDDNKFNAKLHPNPCSDILFVSIETSSDSPLDVDLIFIDPLGNILLNKKIQTSDSTIDLTRFPSGVYTIRLSSLKQVYTQQIIVQK